MAKTQSPSIPVVFQVLPNWPFPWVPELAAESSKGELEPKEACTTDGASSLIRSAGSAGAEAESLERLQGALAEHTLATKSALDAVLCRMDILEQLARVDVNLTEVAPSTLSKSAPDAVLGRIDILESWMGSTRLLLAKVDVSLTEAFDANLNRGEEIVSLRKELARLYADQQQENSLGDGDVSQNSHGHISDRLQALIQADVDKTLETRLAKATEDLKQHFDVVLGMVENAEKEAKKCSQQADVARIEQQDYEKKLDHQAVTSNIFCLEAFQLSDARRSKLLETFAKERSGWGEPSFDRQTSQEGGAGVSVGRHSVAAGAGAGVSVGRHSVAAGAGGSAGESNIFGMVDQEQSQASDSPLRRSNSVSRLLAIPRLAGRALRSRSANRAQHSEL